MHASETKLQSLIEGTKQYVVPLFQRAYSWKKEQWEILWEDIMSLYDDEEDGRNHFIGSIVTMPTNSVPEGVQKYLLIDGQQRLTTFFILLAVLRDFVGSDNNAYADEIQETMLVNRFKKDNDFYKLMPTQLDRHTFKLILDKSDLGEDKNNIKECYDFFISQLKDPRQKSVDLERIKRIVTSQLSIVSIVLDPNDNPHLVFESLNAKGRSLEQADLIRNYFFMRILINQQEELHVKYWLPMQNSLKEKLTEFIRHYMMKDGAIVKKDQVYFQLKEILQKGEVTEALKTLAKFAKHYEKLLYPEKEGNEEIRQSLENLNRIEVTTAYPFLLNCYEDYANQIIDSKILVSILKTVENFSFRRFICNVPTNALNKIFPVLYGRIQRMVDLQKISFVDALQNDLQKQDYPKDSEFFEQLISIKLYSKSGDRRDRAKFLLEILERSYPHKESVNLANTTIEHVMPQTLSEWWKNHIGEEQLGEHELMVHTLGNLTLTGYNSELSNDSFTDKKKVYAKSHIEMNDYFETQVQWTHIEIKRRSEVLAKRTLEIWSYFGEDNTQIISDNGEVKGKKPLKLIMFGTTIPIKTWRDVMEQTLEMIIKLKPDRFEELVNEFPSFIGFEETRYRQSRKLSNNFYLELNVSAKTVRTFCIQAMQVIGLTSDDWKVLVE
jgi:uncharacterized protein with ParB-like and HNH nuclease domain